MANAEQTRSNEQTRPKWCNPLALVAGVLFLADMLLKYAPVIIIKGGKWPAVGGLDPVALALVVVGLLPWISEFLSGAKLPGGIEVAFRAVERRQELNERAIQQLRFIVDGFLTRDEYQHLKNIKKGKQYTVRGEEAAALASELRRLRALRLIEQVDPKRGVRDFAVPNHVGRLVDWFRLTPKGTEYLEMRKENETLGAQPAPTAEEVQTSTTSKDTPSGEAR
jgi:hypothetical protein